MFPSTRLPNTVLSGKVRADFNERYLNLNLNTLLQHLQFEQRSQRIVIPMATSHQPMNKLSSAEVRRLLNYLFLKARLKVRLFAQVGDRLRSPPRGLRAAVFLGS